MRSEVLTSIKMTVFLFVTPGSLVVCGFVLKCSRSKIKAMRKQHVKFHYNFVLQLGHLGRCLFPYIVFT
jgi:hypothetical protein